MKRDEAATQPNKTDYMPSQQAALLTKNSMNPPLAVKDDVYFQNSYFHAFTR
jgi:hypothetical protein